MVAEVEYLPDGKKIIKAEQEIDGVPSLIVCDGKKGSWLEPNTYVRVLYGFSREGDVLKAEKDYFFRFDRLQDKNVSEHIARLEKGEHVVAYDENVSYPGTKNLLDVS